MSIKYLKLLSAFFVLLIFPCLISKACASGIIFNSDITAIEGQVGAVRGWEFDVTAPEGVILTKLGIYDDSADGLVDSHSIGVWSSDGTLLISTIVPSGEVAPLDINSLFRTVDIENIFLPQSSGYRIGAFYIGNPPPIGDVLTYDVLNLIMPPGIKFVRDRSALTVSVLTFPEQTFHISPGIFGPGFESMSVPLPLSALLFILGLATIGLTKLRYDYY